VLSARAACDACRSARCAPRRIASVGCHAHRPQVARAPDNVGCEPSI
jgi:hypothetical protein